jgi:hypothetical protein
MWKKLRTIAFIATLLLTIATTSSRVVNAAIVRDDVADTSNVFQKLKAQYNDLSPRGKLVTGAAFGFFGSRLALGTVTKVVKIGAGAFIV